jgi:hypothetical protein
MAAYFLCNEVTACFGPPSRKDLAHCVVRRRGIELEMLAEMLLSILISTINSHTKKTHTHAHTIIL